MQLSKKEGEKLVLEDLLFWTRALRCKELCWPDANAVEAENLAQAVGAKVSREGGRR